jgi:radical SAM superfamily enzyme YgiQ (UPF0313 family)
LPILNSQNIKTKLINLEFSTDFNYSGDVYLLTSLTYNCYSVYEIVKKIKRNNPKALVIMGGPHVSFQDLEALSEGVDIVVRGEGEKTLEKIVRYTNGEIRLDEIDGISYINSGKIKRNSSVKCISDLDSLPMLDYSTLPSEYKNSFYFRIFTQRGCPMNCVFCGDVLWKNKLIKKSVKRLEAELNSIVKNLNFIELQVLDSCFSFDRKYSLEVAEIISSFNLEWSCQTRVDLVDKELLKKYKECGCIEVEYGGESVIPFVLEKSNKRIKPELFEKTFKITKDAGLKVHTNWMIGLPGDNPEFARATIDYVVRMIKEGLIDTADYFITVPYPGTPLFNNPKKYNMRILTYDWSKYNENTLPVMELINFSQKEIFELWKEGIDRITEAMATSI